MPKKLDLRRVRTGQTYSFREAADLLGVAVGTVRTWRRKGLPVLDGQKPILIYGADLKAWLRARYAARKKPCGRGEFFCCRCQEPRKPKAGSVRIIPKNQKTLMVRGRCATCGAAMCRFGAMANRADIEANFRIQTGRQVRLVGCENAPVKIHFGRDQDE